MWHTCVPMSISNAKSCYCKARCNICTANMKVSSYNNYKFIANAVTMTIRAKGSNSEKHKIHFTWESASVITWNGGGGGRDHISKIASKANFTLGFLRRNLKGCPSKLKDIFFNGSVNFGKLLSCMGSVPAG